MPVQGSTAPHVQDQVVGLQMALAKRDAEVDFLEAELARVRCLKLCHSCQWSWQL